MLCAKLGWNWSSGSWEEDFFLISSMHFRYFIIIFPWKRAGPFIRTNLGSGSLHPRMHCAKLGWNWSDVLYLYVYLMCLLIVCYVSMPAVCKVRFIQCFVPRWVEIVLEKKMKMWKVYDNNNDANGDNNDDNDDGQRTNFDQKSSLEPSAQVSKKVNSSLPLYLGFQFYVPQTRQNSAFHPYSNV